MDKPVVTAFNKMDRIGESLTVRDFKADRIVQVSAKTGEGLEALLQAIEEILPGAENLYRTSLFLSGIRENPAHPEVWRTAGGRIQRRWNPCICIRAERA